MQTRFILHIGYRRNTPVACMVEVGGQYIGFLIGSATDWLSVWRNRSTTSWLARPYLRTDSVVSWKQESKTVYGAHRFARLVITGDTAYQQAVTQ